MTRHNTTSGSTVLFGVRHKCSVFLACFRSFRFHRHLRCCVGARNDATRGMQYSIHAKPPAAYSLAPLWDAIVDLRPVESFSPLERTHRSSHSLLIAQITKKGDIIILFCENPSEYRLQLTTIE